MHGCSSVQSILVQNRYVCSRVVLGHYAWTRTVRVAVIEGVEVYVKRDR